MDIAFTKPAQKALNRMPKADSAAIRAKLAAYAANPAAGDVKALVGTDQYRLRHGDWRAIFTLDGGAITVTGVKHRREAYR